MVGSDIPYFLIHLDHQSRRVRLEAFEAATGRAWHRVSDDEYVTRSSTMTSFFAFPWDGTTFTGKGKSASQWYRVPNGQYIVKVSVLKALVTRATRCTGRPGRRPPSRSLVRRRGERRVTLRAGGRQRPPARFVYGRPIRVLAFSKRIHEHRQSEAPGVGVLTAGVVRLDERREPRTAGMKTCRARRRAVASRSARARRMRQYVSEATRPSATTTRRRVSAAHSASRCGWAVGDLGRGRLVGGRRAPDRGRDEGVPQPEPVGGVLRRGWLAKPAACMARIRKSPEPSPVKTRPVRLAPWAAGASPARASGPRGRRSRERAGPNRPRRGARPSSRAPPAHTTPAAVDSACTPRCGRRSPGGLHARPGSMAGHGRPRDHG